jgi:hypothetical protein
MAYKIIILVWLADDELLRSNVVLWKLPDVFGRSGALVKHLIKQVKGGLLQNVRRCYHTTFTFVNIINLAR